MKEKPEKGCCAQKHFDAKNFLVFDAHLGRAGRSPGRDLDEINSFAAYAITLISPHRVYKVDLRDGRMKLVASQAVRLGFERWDWTTPGVVGPRREGLGLGALSNNAPGF